MLQRQLLELKTRLRCQRARLKRLKLSRETFDALAAEVPIQNYHPANMKVFGVEIYNAYYSRTGHWDWP